MPNRVPAPPGPSPTPSPAPTVPEQIAAWRTMTAAAFSETVEGLDSPLNAYDLLAFMEGLETILTPPEES